MNIALFFAIIGFIGCFYGMLVGMKNEKIGKFLFNFILVVVDICVIISCVNKTSNEAPKVKYSKIEKVTMVNVDSVFTKTKMGVDTTYTIHYVRNPFWVKCVEYNVKHIELDTVFTKTSKDVDTTYIINYIKK